MTSLKGGKKNNCQPKIQNTVKPFYRLKNEKKTDKQKLRDSVSTRPLVQEMLKGVLQSEGKRASWKVGSIGKKFYQSSKYKTG